MLADFKDGKRDEYLTAPYRVYYANDIAYHQSSPEELCDHNNSIHRIVPADHFFESEQHQDPNQQCQLPLGSVTSPPPWPMTLPPIPLWSNCDPRWKSSRSA